MATVQATSTVISAQARTVRVTTVWPPPSGLMHTRPWRSSPLAGPALSTLPPVIPEASEESYENELGEPDSTRELPRTRSPSSSSIVSQAGSLSASASGYGSRNASSSASALVLVEGDTSTSSISLAASTGAHGTSSSQGHGSSQTHPNRPARLSKSWGRRPSSAQGDLAPPKNRSDVFITPPPRARTVSHGHSRSAPFPVHAVTPSPTIPQAYSRASRPRTSPESDANTDKQPLSKSRDPSSNWMSSSPFGPAQAPKFSRLAIASPAVVMPLSAKEYRKQKARDSLGGGKEKAPPTSSNRLSFIDNALSAFQSPNGVPLVKVSPPPLEDVHRHRSPPSSSGDHNPGRRIQPQPQIDHPPSKPLPQASMPPPPSSTKQKRPRSRPNTPPRSSPLAAHPPISPKSSAGTFFSLASASDDDTSRPQGADAPSSMSSPADGPNAANAVPPARPRLRPRRRKSYPDRLSNGARLSLLEAMNRLSQDSAALHRLSGLSQTDGVNRLSVASQASGHTLFYDVVESEGEQGQVTGGKGNGNADGGGQRTPILHTQSLEDLSSTLSRTGIEVVHPNGDGIPGAALDDDRKGKRNVRMVRISDIVEVSPPPVLRRRKLTKSRPGSARGSAPVFGAGPAPGTGIKEVKVQTQTQTQERRASLLPWKSKGSSDRKAGVVGTGSGVAAAAGERGASTPTKGPIHLDETTAPTPFPHSLSPIANGSTHIESHSKPKSNGMPFKKMSSDTPASMPTTAPSPDPKSVPSAPPRKSRRSTFSFLPSPTFHRPKREKSNATPPGVDLGLDQNTKGKPKGSAKGIESGTDSTSTSIRTITQGSQTTLVPASPEVFDLTTPASSGILSGSGRDTRSSVPMLRRLNAQEMATTGVPSQSEWDGKGDSTPSLISNGSTATFSSAPRTPSLVRLSGGGEPFVPRPSGLKESFTDASEEDSEGILRGGRTSRMCVHRRQEQSPLARASVGWGETSEDDERHLRPSASPRPGSRPGTSSSTLTTATETSGSYASFSTVPASTVSSSSTSRSESPPPVVGDIRDRMVSVLQGGDGDEDVHACALCGHQPTSPPISPSPSPTRKPDLPEMHPMFTVPLLTIPASSLGTYPRSSSNTPSAMPGGGRHTGTGSAWYAGRRKSERHTSVPLPDGVGVSVPPTRHDQNHMHVNANGGPVTTTSTKTRTMAMTDKMTPSPSPLPPPPKARLQRRPQTAPAGTGDAASKFIEDAKAMRAREGTVDVHVGGDRSTKHKAGSGESRFKAVLKGLLRWTG